MLVTKNNFDKVLESFENEGLYSLDTETTGLNIYKTDRLFSIILADSKEAYYFNFQPYKDLFPDWILPRSWLTKFQKCLANPRSIWFMHNAKFDLGMLMNESLEVLGIVHCTQAIERVLYNAYLPGEYSLAKCAERRGLKKSEAVSEYVSKHKLYDMVVIPGKKKKVKLLHYDRVPFEIIYPYGEQDGRVTHGVGIHQLETAEKLDKSRLKHQPAIMEVINTERMLTKTCFKMEQNGIKIDRDFCEKALRFENDKAENAKKEFKKITNLDFKDSNKALATAFSKMGESYPVTEKGNPSFTDDVLEGFNSPLAKTVQNFRTADKKANTYYSSFLWYADKNDRVHANIKQDGTETGRFSYSEPNLQNIPKEESGEEEFIVRKAFIPDKDYCLVSIDFNQMEYRLMLDLAKETSLIEKIIQDGLDVHEATGKAMGVTREKAKTLNFMLLYGGGAGKLASSLGIKLDEAKALRDKYFEALPAVAALSRILIATIKRTKFVFNWAGRIYHCPREEFAYRIPNHLIQGGCADVVKKAMNSVQDYLAVKKSSLLLQVHDELLFQIHKSELSIVKDLKNIMETSYPYKYLPLTCSVSHSWKSWGDPVKGEPLDAK